MVHLRPTQYCLLLIALPGCTSPGEADRAQTTETAGNHTETGGSTTDTPNEGSSVDATDTAETEGEETEASAGEQSTAATEGEDSSATDTDTDTSTDTGTDKASTFIEIAITLTSTPELDRGHVREFAEPIGLNHCSLTKKLPYDLIIYPDDIVIEDVSAILRAEYLSTTNFSAGGDDIFNHIEMRSLPPYVDATTWGHPAMSGQVIFARALQRSAAMYRVDFSTDVEITPLAPEATWDEAQQSVLFEYEVEDMTGQVFTITETHAISVSSAFVPIISDFWGCH